MAQNNKNNNKNNVLKFEYDLTIAEETNLNAAVVFSRLCDYEELEGNYGGWFPATYADMVSLLPLTDEQIYRAYKKLVAAGYIEYKVKRINDMVSCYFRILKSGN